MNELMNQQQQQQQYSTKILGDGAINDQRLHIYIDDLINAITTAIININTTKHEDIHA